MTLPTLYTPLQPADFIGDAAEIARQLQIRVQAAREAGNAPIRLLLSGDPGCGKSALVRYLQALLKCNKWNTYKFNGTQLKVDNLEDITRTIQLRDLFGDYRLLWVDEADAIPAVAQVRTLTLLDDLPNGVAVACTSNRKLKAFDERWQSRFAFFEVGGVPTHEVLALLERLAPTVPKATLAQIANFSLGNVRQALHDAEAAILAAPLAQAA